MVMVVFDALLITAQRCQRGVASRRESLMRWSARTGVATKC